MNNYKFTGKFPVRTKNGIVIATSFLRVVVGERGAYVEFHNSQILKTGIEQTSTPHYYYEEWKTLDGIKVYHQLHKVDYADYKVGYWYISPVHLKDFKPIPILKEEK